MADIQHGDVISIRKRRGMVGPRKYLKSLSCSQKSPIPSDRFTQLNKTYCGWRAIKGDGNCYYRAVYFSLFEQIIFRKQYSFFGRLYEKFEHLCFTDPDEHDEHLELLDALQQASSKICVVELSCYAL